jgi:hypothetical protein
MSAVEDQVRRLGGIDVPGLPDVADILERGVERRRHRHRWQGLVAAVVVVGLGVSLATVLTRSEESRPTVSVDEPQPEPEPEPDQGTVTVPDVIGLPLVQARSAVASAGLAAAFDIGTAAQGSAAGADVTSEVGTAEPRTVGLVVAVQDPAAGSVVAAGSTVTLRVGGPPAAPIEEAQLSGGRWTVVDDGGQLVATLDGVEVWNDQDWQGAPADPTYVPRRFDGPGFRVVFGRVPPRGVAMDIYLGRSDRRIRRVAGSEVGVGRLWAVEVAQGAEVYVIWRDAHGNEQERLDAYPLVPGT